MNPVLVVQGLPVGPEGCFSKGCESWLAMAS